MERGLYIVPTPIGNLEDITLRGLSLLRQVDLIAAEDTRHSQRLLSHFDIDTRLISYHEHSGDTETQALVARMVAGQAIALISDAGTPLVSDPGYRLVRAAQHAGLPVTPLPGACAAITALSASGLATDRFHFEGFLPSKAAQRCARLEALVDYQGTLVCYEAPHRIAATLTDAMRIFGADREAVLARELTKAFETIKRLPLGELTTWVLDDANQQRGEQVLMIAGAAPESEAIDASVRAWLRRLAIDLPPRKAAAIVAEMTGLKARTLYNVLLAARDR